MKQREVANQFCNMKKVRVANQFYKIEKKANVLPNILAKKKTDVHCYMVKMERPNSHLYWSLKDKNKGNHILVLYCQLPKKSVIVNLELELERYQIKYTACILWAMMLGTCTDSNPYKRMPICAPVHAVAGLPSNQN